MFDATELKALAGELDQEILSLDLITREARACLVLFATREPTSLELRGAETLTHDFCTLVEHFLSRVGAEINDGRPAGQDGHATLRLLRESPELRPAVLRPAVRQTFEPCARAQRLLRHRYGFELEWRKIRPLLEQIAAMATDVRADFAAFVMALHRLADNAQ